MGNRVPGQTESGLLLLRGGALTPRARKFGTEFARKKKKPLTRGGFCVKPPLARSPRAHLPSFRVFFRSS